MLGTEGEGFGGEGLPLLEAGLILESWESLSWIIHSLIRRFCGWAGQFHICLPQASHGLGGRNIAALLAEVRHYR